MKGDEGESPSFDVMRTRNLVSTSSEVHRTEDNLPREIQAVPELGIVHTQRDGISPNCCDLLRNTSERTETRCGRQEVCGEAVERGAGGECAAERLMRGEGGNEAGGHGGEERRE